MYIGPHLGHLNQWLLAGPKDVMNWFSAQAECSKYGMSMLRIAGEQKVSNNVTAHQSINRCKQYINVVIASWAKPLKSDKQEKGLWRLLSQMIKNV